MVAAGCCDQPEYISCQPLDTDRAPTSGGDEGYEESGRRADLGADILGWAGRGSGDQDLGAARDSEFRGWWF